MKTLFVLVFLVSFLVGCGKEIQLPEIPVNPESPSTPASPDVASSPVTTDNSGSPSIPSGPSTFSLTVYSITKTVAPQPLFITKTYTATGYCLVYESKTYCWDDGMKTVTLPSFGNFYYSYFNMSKNVVGFSHSNGGMQSDLMTVPTVITPGGGLAINMGAGDVNLVLNTGTPSTATCLDTNGIVDCGSFTIDTKQVPL